MLAARMLQIGTNSRYHIQHTSGHHGHRISIGRVVGLWGATKHTTKGMTPRNSWGEKSHSSRYKVKTMNGRMFYLDLRYLTVGRVYVSWKDISPEMRPSTAHNLNFRHLNDSVDFQSHPSDPRDIVQIELILKSSWFQYRTQMNNVQSSQRRPCWCWFVENRFRHSPTDGMWNSPIFFQYGHGMQYNPLITIINQLSCSKCVYIYIYICKYIYIYGYTYIFICI